uniref:Rhamnogalacturonase A/B/Epimerase-like pectate lyase domain-containing protein n=1 Tax=Moniliophthora roreri TaxID=221103 RepID=A0A0W0FZR5_MONRR
MRIPLLLLGTLLKCTSIATSLGTSCSAPLGPGTAAPGDPFWLEDIAHEGVAAFNPSLAEYQVFRNVKSYGAVGDGVHDDGPAINAAIAAGNRCGGGTCPSSTVTPAIVYFPKGTYLVSSPIIAYYYTQLIGDARDPPTLLASEDVDPYLAGGAQWYQNQNNFFRSVRNFVIDTRRVPATNAAGTGIHWQVAQATSLMNIVFYLSDAPNTAHQGIWMENGSGGYMGDLVFNGGKYAIFTVRNVTMNGSQAAVFAVWNWGWTFQGITINNCSVGFDIATGGLTLETQTVGAEAIIDAVVTDTPIFIRTSKPSNGSLAGSLVVNNARLNNVPIAVGVLDGPIVLPGGTISIDTWVQGNVYSGFNSGGTFTQGNIPGPNKPSVLLDNAGRIFGKTHPQYADYAVSQFISVKSYNAKGDGVTDDTAALQAVFDQFAGCKIIYFPHGTYIVTSTLRIPADTQIVGEAWSVIAGRGPVYSDYNNPVPVIRAGEPGSQGILEITDIIFATVGPAAGAIVVEWNVRQPDGMNGATGMWDTHIRLGGGRSLYFSQTKHPISLPEAAGTQLELECPADGSGGTENCFAAFLALHLKPSSTAYLEGTWIWLADHDLDGDGVSQISIYSGRGLLSESRGPIWLLGIVGAEHHVQYQFQLVNAKNHYLGLIQTETPYFQPNPAPSAPFITNRAYNDPEWFDGGAWALRVVKSEDIIVFGAGLYSLFNDYQQTCLDTVNCQGQIVSIDNVSDISIYSLTTLGVTYQLSVNEQPIINQASNINGFGQTVTVWTPQALQVNAEAEVSLEI